MIALFKRNNSLYQTANYNEKEHASFIQSNLHVDNTKDFVTIASQNERLYKGESETTTLHVIISPHIDDSGKMDDATCKYIINKYIEKMNLQDFDYIAYLHKDKQITHLHIVISAFNNKTGEQYDLKNEFKQDLSFNTGYKIAKELNFITARDNIKPKNTQKEAKAPTEQDTIKNKIIQVLDKALKQKPATIEEYFELIQKQGYEVEKFYAKNTDILRGYGIKISADIYPISKLDKKYSYHNLTKNHFTIQEDITPVINEVYQKEKIKLDINSLYDNKTKDIRDLKTKLESIGYKAEIDFEEPSDQDNQNKPVKGLNITKDDNTYFLSTEEFLKQNIIQDDDFYKKQIRDYINAVLKDKIINENEFIQKMKEQGYKVKKHFTKIEKDGLPKYVFNDIEFVKHNFTYKINKSDFNDLIAQNLKPNTEYNKIVIQDIENINKSGCKNNKEFENKMKDIGYIIKKKYAEKIVNNKTSYKFEGYEFIKDSNKFFYDKNDFDNLFNPKHQNIDTEYIKYQAIFHINEIIKEGITDTKTIIERLKKQDYKIKINYNKIETKGNKTQYIVDSIDIKKHGHQFNYDFDNIKEVNNKIQDTLKAKILQKIDVVFSNVDVKDKTEYFQKLKDVGLDIKLHYDQNNAVRGYSVGLNNEFVNSYELGRKYCLNNLIKASFKVKTKQDNINYKDTKTKLSDFNDKDLQEILKNKWFDKSKLEPFRIFKNLKQNKFCFGFNNSNYFYDNKKHYNNQIGIKILNDYKNNDNNACIIVENIHDSITLIKNGVKNKIICLNGKNNIEQCLKYIKDKYLFAFAILEDKNLEKQLNNALENKFETLNIQNSFFEDLEEILKVDFQNPIDFVHQLLRTDPKFDFLDLKRTIDKILNKYILRNEEIDSGPRMGM